MGAECCACFPSFHVGNTRIKPFRSLSSLSITYSISLISQETRARMYECHKPVTSLISSFFRSSCLETTSSSSSSPPPSLSPHYHHYHHRHHYHHHHSRTEIQRTLYKHALFSFSIYFAHCVLCQCTSGVLTRQWILFDFIYTDSFIKCVAYHQFYFISAVEVYCQTV
jgi:hypothetical protein